MVKYILTEDKRSQLLSKSKSGKKEKDGKNRYEKRLKSRFSTNVRNYNSINMNSLFKDNIITVDIDVKGETKDYVVTISFGGFLNKLQYQLKGSEKIDLRNVIRALIDAFNDDNVYIRCTCEDFHYRFGYWLSKTDIIQGKKEDRPSKITNPNNELGDGCKHIMLVLANHSWLIKVASVIVNYINYMQKHRERLYQDFIYPAIFNKKYEAPVQLDIFDDELDSTKDTLDKANIEARKKGQFQAGNKYRFQPKNKDQIRIDDNVGEEDA